MALEMMELAYGAEIDGAGLRLVGCAGYLLCEDGVPVRREKPAGFYIEKKDEAGNWVPIKGPYWGGPIGGYPPRPRPISGRCSDGRRGIARC